jgi:dihydropteroate synthase
MGIVNVTPDSFYDGGKFFSIDSAIEHGLKLIEEGADILDIGGESTRPAAEPISFVEEISRVIPVIEAIALQTDIPISIDTYRAAVAKSALDIGATIVNDISAMRFDDEMPKLLAERKCPVILMHMKGAPRNMQDNPVYEKVVAEVFNFLKERIEYALANGIESENIWIDPGIGFGKRLEDNLDLLAGLSNFRELGKKVVIGTSRKSFIGKILGDIPPEERLFGTLGSTAWCALAGADIVRVHDVAETKQALAVMSQIAGRISSGDAL